MELDKMTSIPVPTSVAEARPAATVVLLREAPGGFEALLLLRSRKLGFHGGEWVFPGGRVDAADAEPGPADLASEAAARRAAAREAHEEAGVVLDAASFVPLAHWTTPIVLPKRFATYFFLAEVESDEITVDGGEIEAHQWLRPADAIRLRDAGELGLPPPTFVTLTELAAHDTLASALDAFRHRELPRLQPNVAMSGDVIVNLLVGDAGFELGNVDAEGPRHRVVMDPRGWR
jgi:8-oxo-dGTP pyrophosphatase MutT (NUDIX family)